MEVVQGGDRSMEVVAQSGFGLVVEFLPTSKVISGWVLSCDSAQLYSAPFLGNQAAGTMTHYPTQSHYPDTKLTSPYTILLMSINRLASNTCQ